MYDKKPKDITLVQVAGETQYKSIFSFNLYRQHMARRRKRSDTAPVVATTTTTTTSVVLAFLLFFHCIAVSCVAAISTKPNGDPIDYLDEDSVVMITGAAGFIGSELALALHRTYSPKRIICVDRMGDHPSTQEELALFEFQRQRAFHVMQTLGPKARFYRVDFRPMIPEYYDMGEVPVLDHIFLENTDITHVGKSHCIPHRKPKKKLTNILLFVSSLII